MGEAQRLLGEIDRSERLELAQTVMMVNSNPQRTVQFFIQPLSRQVVLNAMNLPKADGERLIQLILERYPEATENVGSVAATAAASGDAQDPDRPVRREDVYLPGLFRPVPMPEPSERDVFVIMSFSREQRDAYNLAIAPTLRRLGLTPRRIDEVQHNATVTVEIVRHIERAIFVVADLTGERPNVYYEVGYAHRANKEVVLLARKNTAVHFDVAAINRIDYEDFTELVDALEKRVRAIAERLGIDLTPTGGDA